MILKTRYTIDEKSLYLYYTFVNSKGDDYICFCALASIVFDEQNELIRDQTVDLLFHNPMPNQNHTN